MQTLDEVQKRELIKSLDYVREKTHQILSLHWNSIGKIPHEEKEDDFLSTHESGIFYRHGNMIYRAYYNSYTVCCFMNETEAIGHFELIRMVVGE